MASIDETGLVLDTLEDYEDIARQEIRNKIPEADLSEGEDYDNLARVMAADAWQHQNPILYGVQQIFVATADTPYLQRHGNERRIPWPEAAIASGFVLLTGANGSVQGNGSTFTAGSGVTYQSTAAVTIAIAAWANKTVTAALDPAHPDQLVLSSTAGMAVNDVFLLGGVVYAIKEVLSASSILVYGKILAEPTVGVSVVSPTLGVLAPIVATAAGASGNASFYDQLTNASPGAGVNTLVLMMECSGGADKLTNEQYAIFLQDVDAEYPAGGNRSQLLLWGRGYNTETKTLDVLGIDRDFVYPTKRGPGTVDIYPQGVARARHLSTTKRTELQNFISPAAPTEAQPGLAAPGADILVLDFLDQPTEVSVAIQSAPGYEPDWVGSFTVGAGSTQTRIVLTADPTTLIQAGSRVAVRIGVNFDLVLATVDTVDAAGVNLTSPLTVAPSAGETLYPGSSLIEPVRDAILAIFDGLGTGDTSPPSRYPPPSLIYPANLDRALIISKVRAVEGVLNMTLPLPVADVIAPAASQITLSKLTITHI